VANDSTVTKQSFVSIAAKRRSSTRLILKFGSASEAGLKSEGS